MAGEIKVARLVSSEYVIALFDGMKVKDPLQVVVVPHPKDPSKPMIQLMPLNTFGIMGEELELNPNSIMFWVNLKNMPSNVVSEYQRLTSSIITPPTSKIIK